jgi:multicomponent K+:H+ antiporter subunit E
MSAAMARVRAWSRPALILSLAAVWLLLVNSAAPGHIALGLTLGAAIAWVVAPVLGGQRSLPRAWGLVRLVTLVLWDILVANISVARRILGPMHALRPRFVNVPLDVTCPTAITALAAIITLTPGTVSADLSADGRVLLVHGLDIADPQALVATIKRRYETPLRRIFEC